MCQIAVRQASAGGYLISPWRPQRPAPVRWDGDLSSQHR
jgi:hypothetical protein